MPFDENGFLGADAEEFANQIRERQKTLLALCRDINQLAEKIKFEFNIHSDNGQEVVCACLFVRIIEGAQAATILVERGLDTDAQVVIRGVFEALALLKICSTDEEFCRKYITYSDVIRLSTFEKSRKPGRDGVWKEIASYATDEMIESLEKKIASRGFSRNKIKNEFKVKEILNKAQMADMYDSFYAVLCDYVHTNSSSLNKYIEINEDGEMVQFNHGPCEENARVNLSAIGEFLIIAVGVAGNLFDVDRDEELKELHARLI